MEPKVLIIMGMGGLLCFMFIIMAVIWLSGSDDEGTESGTGSGTSGGDNSGGDNSGGDNSGGDNSGGDNSSSSTTSTADCPTGQIKKDGVCYRKCIGGEITVNCNNYLGLGTSHYWEHRDDCAKRFFRSSDSSTGFYQCMWNADHCNTQTTGGLPIECIPEGSEDEHLCAEGVTWQEAGTEDNCECPSGTEYGEHGDGGGRWRCCNNTEGPNGEACPAP